MASFTYTAGDTWLTITVRGLSSGQRVRYFVRREPGTSAVIDSTYTSSGSSLTKTFNGLQQSTRYAANAGIVSGSSTAWIDAQYFTTKSSSGGGGEPVGPTRPTNWQWWSTIQRGAIISISANEWNSFCSKINEFRAYKGLRVYYFSTVSRGTSISASIVNEAWSAISQISGHGTLPSSAIPGQAITAYFFTQLANALNSIS